LAGDWEAARRVELVLPETGVCSRSAVPAESDATGAAAAACCGGPTYGALTVVAEPEPATSSCCGTSKSEKLLNIEAR
jgi:hypothetical protein